MKRSAKLGYLFATALAATSGVAIAQGKDIKGDPKNSGYVLSPNGNVTVDPFALCWRTGYFTKEQALAECDPSLMPPPPPPPPPPPAPPPPPDADADGVADDGSDKCLGEKEDGLPPDPKDGCLSSDPDADGIMADADKCPTEPETKNGYKDDDGCPDVPQVELAATELKLNEKIQFAAGKPDIEPASQELLAAIAKVLKENPQIDFVEVASHTDKSGKDWADVTLTKKRAEAVVKALISLGVEKNRMRAAGYGPYCAVDPGETDEAREKNRRVDVKIMRISGTDTNVELGCAAASTKGLKPAGVPRTAPKSGAKAAEAKPAGAKPAETKPTDLKPAEPKPTDVAPISQGPAEAKPADKPAADTKPAQMKPADKPADTKPAAVK